jgi:hypothetical protein
MPDPTDDREETNEGAEKPTITIAEREAGEGTKTSADAKPTITIAEKDGGE